MEQFSIIIVIIFFVTVFEGQQPERKFFRANFHQRGGAGIDFVFSLLTLSGGRT